jgi:hypothetical protein
MRPFKIQAGGLVLDFDTLPEGDVTRDLLSGIFGRRIIPGRVVVGGAIDLNVVVARQPLPVAGGVHITGAEILALDRVGWEVVIAFDHDGLITLGEDCAVPNCLCHYQ